MRIPLSLRELMCIGTSPVVTSCQGTNFGILEGSELGNLSEVLETARKEERRLRFEDKVSLCLDIAHGLDTLHACGKSP